MKKVFSLLILLMLFNNLIAQSKVIVNSNGEHVIIKDDESESLDTTVTSFNRKENLNKKGLPAEVVEEIKKRIEGGAYPSIAIATIDSTGVQYYNFGKTTENGRDVDEHTIYEIGSISKVFTAIMLAQQVLEGDLKLEDPINNFLPDGIKVPVMGDSEITFGNLTDHTSGLPRMPDNFNPTNPNNPYADYTVEQLYEFISDYEPVRPVGAAYEYSNLAQGLLGHLLAVNKNSTFEKLMVQTIADPLKMKNTRIEFTQEMKEKLALGHSEGKEVENWDIPTLAGAGAIRSSTSDMAKFIKANLGYDNTSLLEAMELTHQVRYSKAGQMSVGMSWHIKKGNKGDIIWHNGGTAGYKSFAGFVKETGKGVVVLSNSSTSADDIGFHLLDASSELANMKFKNEAIKVPETTLKQYIGIYELQPGFTITITKEGNQLFGQATGQEKFEIYPESETLFYLTIIDAKVDFNLEKGVVTGLTLFQGGQEMVGQKIE